MLWFVFVYLLVFLYFSKLALKCYIDLVILFDVTSIICFVVNKFLALSFELISMHHLNAAGA